MAFSEIHHVDEVPYAGAVVCWPIASKNLDFLATSYSDLGDERKEVAGYAERVFSDLAAGVGAHGVEIPEGCDAPSVGSAAVEMREHLLNSGLGKAVGIDGFDGCRFRDRNSFGVAVDGGAAAEDKCAAVMGIHGREQSP